MPDVFDEVISMAADIPEPAQQQAPQPQPEEISQSEQLAQQERLKKIWKFARQNSLQGINIKRAFEDLDRQFYIDIEDSPVSLAKSNRAKLIDQYLQKGKDFKPDNTQDFLTTREFASRTKESLRKELQTIMGQNVMSPQEMSAFIKAYKSPTMEERKQYESGLWDQAYEDALAVDFSQMSTARRIPSLGVLNAGTRLAGLAARGLGSVAENYQYLLSGGDPVKAEALKKILPSADKIPVLHEASEFGHSMADMINREAEHFEAGAAGADELTIDNPFLRDVAGAARGAVTNITEMALAGATGGGSYAMLAMAGLEEANQSYTRAKDAGLSENEAKLYAGAAGITEFGVGAVFQKLGLGGVESAMAGRNFVWGGVRKALKDIGKDTLNELAEENITEILHGIRDLATINPDMNISDFGSIVYQTTLQTVLMSGMGGANEQVSSFLNRKTRKAAKALPKDAREILRNAGINLDTQEGREKAAQLMTAAIEQRQRFEQSQKGTQEPQNQPDLPQQQFQTPTPAESPQVPVEGQEMAPVAISPDGGQSNLLGGRITDKLGHTPRSGRLHSEMPDGKAVADVSTEAVIDMLEENPDLDAYFVGLDVINQKALNELAGGETEADEQFLKPAFDKAIQAVRDAGYSFQMVKHGGDEVGMFLAGVGLTSDQSVDAGRIFNEAFRKSLSDNGIDIDSMENARAKKPRWKPAPDDVAGQQEYDLAMQQYLQGKGSGVRVGVAPITKGVTFDDLWSRISPQHKAQKEGKPYELPTDASDRQSTGIQRVAGEPQEGRTGIHGEEAKAEAEQTTPAAEQPVPTEPAATEQQAEAPNRPQTATRKRNDSELPSVYAEHDRVVSSGTPADLQRHRQRLLDRSKQLIENQTKPSKEDRAQAVQIYNSSDEGIAYAIRQRIDFPISQDKSITNEQEARIRDIAHLVLDGMDFMNREGDLPNLIQMALDMGNKAQATKARTDAVNTIAEELANEQAYQEQEQLGRLLDEVESKMDDDQIVDPVTDLDDALDRISDPESDIDQVSTTDVEQVELEVYDALKKAGLPTDSIVVVATQAQAERLMSPGGRKRAKGKQINGFYQHSTGKIVLVAENVSDNPVKTALHELVGHKGIEAIPEVNNELLRILKGMNQKKLVPIADTYGFDLTTEKGRIRALKEYIAGKADKKTTNRVVRALKRILKKIGIGDLTDLEIEDLLTKSRRKLQESQETGIDEDTFSLTGYGVDQSGYGGIVNEADGGGQLEIDFTTIPDGARTDADVRQAPENGDGDMDASSSIRGPEVHSIQQGQIPTGLSVVKSAEDVAHIVAPLRKHPQEQLVAVVTDNDGSVLAIHRHTIGTHSRSLFHPIPLIGAISDTDGANRFYIAHNHPSRTAISSKEDRALKSRIKSLTRGTGLKFEGLVTVAGTKAVVDPVDGSEEVIQIAPMARKKHIPVFERRFKRVSTNAQEVNHEDIAKQVIRDVSRGNEGILLLDHRLHPVGYYPINASSMQNLRTGKTDTGAVALLNAMQKTNATNMIVHTKEFDQKAQINMTRFGHVAGARMLDVVYGQSDDLSSANQLGQLLDSPDEFFESSERQNLERRLAMLDRLADIHKGDPEALRKIESTRKKLMALKERGVFGRPDLANPGQTEEARQMVSEVDEDRNQQGRAGVRSDAQVNKEAEQLLRNPEQLKKIVFEAADRGGQLNDAETIAVQKLINKEATKAYMMGDLEAITEAKKLVDAYREARAETARALRQGRDNTMTPAERIQADIIEALYHPIAKGHDKKILEQRQSLREQEQAVAEHESALRELYNEQKQIEQELIELQNEISSLAKDLGITEDEQFSMEDDARAKLAENRQRLRDLRKQLANVKAQIKQRNQAKQRATTIGDQIQKKIDSLQEEDAKRTQQLRNALEVEGVDINRLDTIGDRPVEAADAIRVIQTHNASITDKLCEFWRNAILSALVTHARNLLSNFAFATWNLTGERMAEVVINEFAVKDKNAAQLGELKYLYAGLLPGLSKGLQNLALSWRTERPTFEAQFGDGRTRLDESGVSIKGRTGRFIRAPQRAMMAMDELCKTVFAEMEVGARAYRIAKAEGLSGEAMSRRMAELHNDLNGKAWGEALESARYLTFQNDLDGVLGSIGKGIIKLRKDHRPAFFLVPFVTTPVNVYKAGIRRSPLGSIGLAAELYKAYQTKDYSQVPKKAAEQFFAWSAMLAMYGLAGDDEEPDSIIMTGTRKHSYKPLPPQSIKIGGRWYSYSGVEPLATMATTTIDMINGMKEGTLPDGIGAGMKSWIDQTKDKTFLRSIGDLYEAVTAKEDDSKLARWAAGFGSSFMPNLWRNPNRVLNGKLYETRIWGKDTPDLLSRATARMFQGMQIPYAGYKMRYDMWGREIETAPSRTAQMFQIFSPVKIGQSDNIFIGDEIIMRYLDKQPEERYPYRPRPEFTHNKKKIVMTDDEYEQFQKTAGTVARKRVEAIFKNRKIKTVTESHFKMVSKAIRLGRKQAKMELLANRRKAAK